ncbi:hypothetical protein [Staphylococcus haemolyticus]|uniref:hypothetical protein n=1 Tax=Staphylococcus haemolyticus TaxID=1283 RepID=UPI0018D1C75C|nr:hypothetical protein [Staphylococcus haemolyticus]
MLNHSRLLMLIHLMTCLHLLSHSHLLMLIHLMMCLHLLNHSRSLTYLLMRFDCCCAC